MEALEPANPDARLSLAHAYLEYNENWIAFQQYKKAIWLYSPGTEKSKQADAGLQLRWKTLFVIWSGKRN